MAPDVASDFTESNWIHVSDQHAAGNFRSLADGADEAKARFDCEFGFTAKDDPIVDPGVIGGSSHQHHFVGKRLDLLSLHAANATYANLRGAGYSGCYGGPINRTLYWEPAVYKTLSNGVTVEVKLQTFVSYYISGLLGHTGDIYDPNENTVWPRRWDQISGFNMADPTQWTMSGYLASNPTTNRLNTIIAAANAASHAGKYAASSIPTGFLGWYCETPAAGNVNHGIISTSPVQTGDGHEPWLRNSDGTPTLDCAPTASDGSSGHLVADLITMPCWDGVNLDSPDGRGHMMPSLVDTDTGKEVCPEHWYRVPTFEAKVEFYQTGQSDYTQWWLSSDRMPGMTQFRNGESMHFDLIPGWSYGTTASPGVFLTFMQKCLGLTIKLAASDTALVGSANECGFGAIDSTHQLYVDEAPPAGNPGSPNPIVNINPIFSDNHNRYIRPSTGTAIPGTVHNTH
jgi:hypothetical protein